jgi:hypothetical protein
MESHTDEATRNPSIPLVNWSETRASAALLSSNFYSSSVVLTFSSNFPLGPFRDQTVRGWSLLIESDTSREWQ